MTDTSPPPGAYARHRSELTRAEDREKKSGWTGWLLFTSVLMGMVAVFQIANGLTAVFRSGTYVVGEDRLLVDVDYTVWGWVHVLLGLIAGVAAFCLLAGQMWARVVGIVMAVASALTNLAFIPAYPVGSLVVIVIDVLIVYAIIVHGGELKDDRY